VQLYEQWFEDKCLLETSVFYRQEATKLLDEYNCSEYMERVGHYIRVLSCESVSLYVVLSIVCLCVFLLI